MSVRDPWVTDFEQQQARQLAEEVKRYKNEMYGDYSTGTLASEIQRREDLMLREITSLRDENKELKRKFIELQDDYLTLLAENDSLEKLRNENPGLKELYDQYMTMLVLVRK